MKMTQNLVHIKGDIEFKIRFNTAHADTNLYWRIIIDEQEFLTNSILCNVVTYSDHSFDEKANAIKYHLAGKCAEFSIDIEGKGIFS